MNKFETRIREAWERCSVLEVLQQQLFDFEGRYGREPDIAFMAMSCKTALVKELIKAMNMPPETAVATPVLINNTKLFFSDKTGDRYIVLCHSATNKRQFL